MGASNASGVTLSSVEAFRRHDALPPSMRALYCQAPFKYVPPSDAERKRNTGSQEAVRAWRRHTIAWMCDDLQYSARKTYGPDHPDAEKNRLDRQRGATA